MSQNGDRDPASAAAATRSRRTSLAVALIAFCLSLAVLIAAMAIVFDPFGQRQGGRIAGTAEVGGPFTMVNQRGEAVTDKTFAGKPTAYFFGFTHCPDVCPTALNDMSERLKELGPDADRLNVVFVSVDPEQDTPDQMALYLQSFDPRIVGLTGTPENLAAMAKAFRVYYRKVPTKQGYTMEHSAATIVLDRDGRLANLIAPQEAPEKVLAKLRQAIAS